MKRMLIAILLCFPLICSAKAVSNTQNNFECLMWAVYKEARGEPIKTRRAVLDSIEHRMEARHLEACQVLKQSGQFPYMKYGVKKVEQKWLTEYLEVVNMEPVLKDKRYQFFNDKKFSWGAGHIKIGGMWFSRLKEKRK